MKTPKKTEDKCPQKNILNLVRWNEMNANVANHYLACWYANSGFITPPLLFLSLLSLLWMKRLFPVFNLLVDFVFLLHDSFFTDDSG